MEKVYVTRKIPQAGIDLLSGKCSLIIGDEDVPVAEDSMKHKIKGCAGMLCLLTEKVTQAVIKAGLPTLKVIANYAVGYDNIDVATATESGIWVTNTPGVLTETTADMAWALLMSAARRIAEGDRYVRAGNFRAWGATLLLGGDIYAKTIGIIGAGRIGQAVAKRAAGFDMQILYADIEEKEEMKWLHARRVAIDDLLRQADFITLHVNLTAETHHLINADRLALMKRTAYLVNTSRGPVVDEQALAEALQSGLIAGAGLDVYENEPQVHPDLCLLDNVTLAPHIASGSVETRTKMAMIAARNILTALEGQRPPNAVNEISR